MYFRNRRKLRSHASTLTGSGVRWAWPFCFLFSEDWRWRATWWSLHTSMLHLVSKSCLFSQARSMILVLAFQSANIFQTLHRLITPTRWQCFASIRSYSERLCGAFSPALWVELLNRFSLENISMSFVTATTSELLLRPLLRECSRRHPKDHFGESSAQRCCLLWWCQNKVKNAPRNLNQHKKVNDAWLF